MSTDINQRSSHSRHIQGSDRCEKFPRETRSCCHQCTTKGENPSTGTKGQTRHGCGTTALEKHGCLKATRLEFSKSRRHENDRFGEVGVKQPHARFVGLSWESLGPPSGLVRLFSAVCLTAGSPLRRRVSMPNSVVLLTSLSRLCVVSLTRREHVLESSGLLAQLESAEAASALKASDSSFRQTFSSSAGGFERN